MEERVSISIADGIADVRLVRADKMNALDAAMFDALERTRSFLSELERTGDLSIAKLTLANSQIHELAAH